MLNFAGIKRSTKHSPNHRNNDNAIFTLAAGELIKMGCTVNTYSEDEFMAMETVQEDHIFTMARSKKTVKKLQKQQQLGKTVINSGFGIEQCYRTNMTKKLIENNIPYPKSTIISTDNPAEKLFEPLSSAAYWLKRGDFHAIHKEDVSFVPNICYGIEILKEYKLRGITEAVLSEHLHGDLLKFYGVSGTDFFYWFYPFEFNHTKFNAEAVNGSAKYYAFDENLLKDYCSRAATALDVHIYGGDAIISPKGEMHIIDFNDWPSFAPCREAASVHIAQCIYRHASHKVPATG